MDSLEARLKFIQVLKTLYKTLNLSSQETTTTKQPSLANDTSSPSRGFSSVTVNTTSNGSTSNSSSNTTTTSAEEPVQFYLENYLHHYEDFQQCILDTLQKLDSLDRLYIYIYYIKILETLHPLVLAARKTNNLQVKQIVDETLVPDLKRIVKLVVFKSEVKSLVNLPFCIEKFKILRDIYVSNETKVVTNESYEKYVTEFDFVEQYLDGMEQFRDELFRRYEDTLLISESDNCNPDRDQASSVQVVLNRMEMDRERHKRQKEQKWIVDRSGDLGIFDEREFNNLWDTLGPFDAIDAEFAKQLQSIAKQSYNYNYSVPAPLGK